MKKFMRMVSRPQVLLLTGAALLMLPLALTGHAVAIGAAAALAGAAVIWATV